MQVSIQKFAVEFEEAVQEANNILAAQKSIEKFTALRGGQEELIIIAT